MSDLRPPTGPHAAVCGDHPRERLLARLLDRLWERYRERVPFVKTYERLLASHHATFVNDHIAFRTIACQQPLTGIVSLSRLFEALGYVAAGCYQFPDKDLSAIHLQHPNGQFPKLFVSEWQTWKQNRDVQAVVQRFLDAHRPMLPDDFLTALWNITDDDDSLLANCVDWIESRPWPDPDRKDLIALNDVSQYAAWVLVHAYNVNHFTALINSHGVAGLDDIEKTVAALREAGVPLKSEIEGVPGSKLRQTATAAATADIEVIDAGRPVTIPWSYAYFELAERGEIVDPETGARGRFEGFLGAQATQLFEMTRVKG